MRSRLCGFTITYHVSPITFHASRFTIQSSATDAHSIKRPPDKDRRYQEEPGGQKMSDHRSCIDRELDRQLDRQQPEQRSELDYRIQCYRRCVLERISYSVAYDRGVMKRGALLL